MRHDKGIDFFKIIIGLTLIVFIICASVITTVFVFKNFTNNTPVQNATASNADNSQNKSSQNIDAASDNSAEQVRNVSKKSHLKVVQNNFGQEAIDAGANKCAALYSTLGETMVSNSKYEISTFINKNDPDNYAIGAIVGQVYPEQNLSGSGIVFAVPVEGGCEGTMLRAVVAKNSCSVVASDQLPKNAQKQKNLAGTLVYRLPSGVNILLTPVSDELCVVMTSINLADVK